MSNFWSKTSLLLGSGSWFFSKLCLYFDWHSREKTYSYCNRPRTSRCQSSSLEFVFGVIAIASSRDFGFRDSRWDCDDVYVHLWIQLWRGTCNTGSHSKYKIESLKSASNYARGSSLESCNHSPFECVK